ncbi:MAG: hypothetical protein IGR93_20015 [Hydrococcus sp. C42_A2020_068]|nr:hypothetical protein Ple7327_3265 [Pleurocapsa sp. PCC 7327]MBF2022311.1 hypothetical protein [Hydrococcus sp. C42_A2020_068]
MCDRSEPDSLMTEFVRERSIRRTVKVLEAKRKRIREELEQLIQHLDLLVPSSATSSDLLQEAIQRIGDDAFSQLLMQLMQEAK